MTVKFEDLLKAGAHFGHLTRKWNPAMAPYIREERNGIHIIDLHKSLAKLEEACDAIKNIARTDRQILFVATKKQAKEVVAELAQAAEMPYITERWAGGMLTNFPTIRKAIQKMAAIDKMAEDGTRAALSKREKLQIDRQRAKLEKNLGSIRAMKRLPAALFVVDVMKEHIAVAEAQRLNIPVFGIVDTNSNPRGINYVIPANDDATDSIRLIVSAMFEAIKEGQLERAAERAAENERKEQNETPEVKTTSRRPRRSENNAAE